MTPSPTTLPQGSKEALAGLLSSCLEESLKTEAYTSWTMKTLQNSDQVIATEFTLLTISSYDFRIFILLHSSCNGDALRYASDALHISQDQLTTTRFYDFVGELGNRFCGAFKRDLGYCFPHLGMSTPNRMNNASLKHLKSLSFANDIHVCAKAADGATFYASLLVSIYGTREFRLDKLPKACDQVETGMMELF